MGLLTEWLAYKLNDTVSMKVGSPISAQNFENTYIDRDNTAVTPIIVNNLTYVPIRYLAEALGGEVEFNSEAGRAEIAVSGKKIVITLSTGVITQNGEKMEDVWAIVRNNRTLVPVRALSE